MDDAYDIVNVVLVDRISGILAVQHEFRHILQLLIAVNADDVLPVGHNVPGFFVTEFKDIGDHLGLGRIQHSLLMALIDHGDYLVLIDIILFNEILKYIHILSGEGNPLHSSLPSFQKDPWYPGTQVTGELIIKPAA